MFSNRNAVRHLDERIVRFDTEGIDERDAWRHAVEVMSSYTNTTPTQNVEELVLSPHDADQIASRSVLLRRLGAIYPPVVRGPMSRQGQVWVATGRNPSHSQQPARSHLQSPTQSASSAATFVGGGMFTSTVIAGDVGVSMWQLFLEPYSGSDMFPAPWTIWRMPIDGTVALAEISSAQEWVELVTMYPRTVNGFVYPDWAKIAENYDGVHISLAAVVAAQGWYLTSQEAGMLIGPSYWDVECSYWLRWKFGEPMQTSTT